MPQFEDEDMYEIFDGFLIETAEILEQISTDLMMLEESPDDLTLVNQLFRSFHTIKGTSSFMGFTEISSFTHEAEDLLNKLRKAELAVDDKIVELLLHSRDAIETMVSEIKDDAAVTDFTSLLREIENAKSSTPPLDAESHSEIQSERADETEDLMESISSIEGEGDFSEDEEALLQAAFAEMNASFDTEDEVSTEDESNDREPKLSTDEVTSTADSSDSDDEPDARVTETNKAILSDGLQKDIQKNNLTKPGRKPATTETIRIDINRIESLMDLSGELVLSRNRLAQITSRFEQSPNDSSLIQSLIENYTQMDKVTSDIQNSVMKMRMVPVGKLYQKVPRMVRDLSREFAKKIKLVVSGEETEIDRTIIEELNDPLVHMIRNSCDHGIESNEKRQKEGKSEEGHIYLDAFQEGNNIILKIGDDGAGIDPVFIKAKSLEKGIITQAEASVMTDREIIQLIFAPGFSTAQVVSSVSGRGVGMDVVKTNIKKLKGSIEIESEVGIGSTFIIKLPLTLAIIQGLLVGIENEIYALPLSTVDEVVTISPSELEMVNSQPVIRVRKRIIPVFGLKEVLLESKSESNNRQVHIVIVAHGSEKSGIIVDNLQGQQEIVIKNLGPLLQGTRGIAGSTILGDGTVVMILDIGELISEYLKTETPGDR